MKKLKKILALAAAFVACACMTTSFTTVKGSAALVVPDDYEYEDEWDDDYLLNNLDGEQTIKAEGTPPGGNGEAGEASGCGSSLTVGGAAILLAPALVALLLKKKRD